MTRCLTRWLCAAFTACSLFGAIAARADDYTRTRYPVVLVHGLFGFDAIGPLDYFHAIPQALRDGGATVFVSQESSANASEVRGEQLLAELRALQAAYGYTKFNLIGHSHGGQTVRYVAGVAPELVASVTTVGTPHQGSPVADGVKQQLATTGLTGPVAALVDAFAKVIAFFSGSSQPQDALAALTALDTQGAADFNARFPAGAPGEACGSGPDEANGVRWYSIGSTSVVTNVLDPADGVLGLTSLYFNGAESDGLVGRCSSHWGTVLRDDYPWNHVDQVNQSFGLRGWFTPDPVAFYRSQANRLKLQGL